MRAIAIIVTYNPELLTLQKTILVLKKQNIEVIIVDNSVNFNFSSINLDSVEIILNNYNYGIAKAQNIGITYALKRNVDFICFFDQDSNIPDNFFRDMIDCRKFDVESVFSPLIVDEQTGEELPSFLLSKFGMPIKIFSNGVTDEFFVDLVISSGTVVTSKTFELVGKMNEDLFIDLVDFEWCFRCKKFNVPITCVPSVKMKHSIGVRKSPLTGTIHNPFRNYYKQRNPFYLLSYSHVPKLYSIKLIIISLIQSFIMIVSQRKPMQYIKSTYSAVWDGSKYFIKQYLRG